MLHYLVGNLEGRDHSEDLGIDEKNSITMDLREVGWEDVQWIHLAQDCTSCGILWTRQWKIGLHKKAGNFLTSWVTISFSRGTVLHGVSQWPGSKSNGCGTLQSEISWREVSDNTITWQGTFPWSVWHWGQVKRIQYEEDWYVLFNDAFHLHTLWSDGKDVERNGRSLF
jgi:hypothetical protein